MAEIELRPIGAEPFLMYCPHCGTPAAQATAHDFRTLGAVDDQDRLLRDGDTIPGLYEVLEQSGRRLDHGFDYELLIGSRPCCRRDYYVVEVHLVGFEDRDHDWLSETGTPVFGIAECTRCEDATVPAPGIPPRWLFARHQQPPGPLHIHTFGPFPLPDDDDLEGPYGVCACTSDADDGENVWAHGRQLLLALWDELVALVRADLAGPSGAEERFGRRS